MQSRHVTALLTLAIAMVAVAAASSGQNLLSNPSFATSADGWSLYTSAHFVSSFRADAGSTLPGGSGPGSIQISDTYYGAGWSGTRQQVAVEAGRGYRIAASALVPSDSSTSGLILAAEFFDQDGHAIETGWANFTVSAGAWTALSGTVTAPANAAFAYVALGEFPASDPAETHPSVVLYDDAFFGLAENATMTQWLFVPAAAAAHGVPPTYWSTDAWISNLTGATVTLSGALLRQGKDNSAAVAAPVALGTIVPHGFLRLDDLVTTLGGSEVTGAVYLVATAQGATLPSTLVAVETHTYTPNNAGPGTFGQGIPAVAAGGPAAVTIPGVFQGAEFRTNIGALNTSSGSITLGLTIVNAAGSVVASATWTLKPYEHKQVALTSLGVTSLDGGTATFTLTTSGSFRAYASSVDQGSGDAVYNEAR